MIFSAVLDANVLYPFSLRDTLLRFAEIEVYAPLWSGRILDEMARSLREHAGLEQEEINDLRGDMVRAFEEAEVGEREIAELEPAMRNDEKDRHVLAAAVAADAEVVVTFNLRHFPPEACEPVGVEARHPDEFLLDVYDLDPDSAYAMIANQAADLVDPPITFLELLERLANGGVPNFAQRVRDHHAARGS